MINLTYLLVSLLTKCPKMFMAVHSIVAASAVDTVLMCMLICDYCGYVALYSSVQLATLI